MESKRQNKITEIFINEDKTEFTHFYLLNIHKLGENNTSLQGGEEKDS